MYNYNYTAAVQLGFNEAMNNIPAVSNISDALLACPSRIYNKSQHESSIVTEVSKIVRSVFWFLQNLFDITVTSTPGIIFTSLEYN